MVAYLLIHGELTSESYTDATAADPRIDEVRAKIHCEDKTISVDYHEPSKCLIFNAILVKLNDGSTVLDEVVVEYPVGHNCVTAQKAPLSLIEKFKRHVSHHFDAAHQNLKIPGVVSDVNLNSLSKLRVDKFTDLFVKQ